MIAVKKRTERQDGVMVCELFCQSFSTPDWQRKERWARSIPLKDFVENRSSMPASRDGVGAHDWLCLLRLLARVAYDLADWPTDAGLGHYSHSWDFHLTISWLTWGLLESGLNWMRQTLCMVELVNRTWTLITLRSAISFNGFMSKVRLPSIIW